MKARRHSRKHLRACLGLGSLALAAVAGAQTAPVLHFYILGNSQVTLDKAGAIAKTMGFTQQMNAAGAPIPIWGMADGSVRQLFVGNSLQIVPNLGGETGTPPTMDATLRFINAFQSQFGLLPDDVSKWSPAESLLWSGEKASPTGAGNPVTPIRGVRYQRMLDGLPVYGPNSALNFECDSHGLIGLLCNIRPVSTSELVPAVKQNDQIDNEYAMDVRNMLAQNPGTVRLLSKIECYVDQGQRYLQPAFRYRIEIAGKQGDVTGEEFFIPIATNTPEPIIANHFNGFDPIMPEMAPKPPVEPHTSSVRLGEYVVRQDADQNICLNIANNFAALAHANAPIVGRAVNRVQYYWGHEYLWAPFGGVSDLSSYYPGAVDFAVVIAHGAPWEFSSLSNTGEWLDLHKMDHYGANSGTGNPSHDYTSYMLFTSCSMMPAPGDGYGGYYTSGGPFDVYWNMFWGMHGLYGYRSTAGKQSCVDSFSNFALAGSLGVPLTAAWMNATGSLDHSSGWNYGTAVLPSGRESDTMYNTTSLPAASSLTMWWNHS